MIKNVYRSRSSCQILIKIYFFYRFQKNIQVSNFMKIRPVGAELLKEDGRTDGKVHMTQIMVAFRNFANRPKTA